MGADGPRPAPGLGVDAPKQEELGRDPVLVAARALAGPGGPGPFVKGEGLGVEANGDTLGIPRHTLEIMPRL